MHTIYVLSDGTGRTAEQSLKAALTQFPNTKVNILVRPNIRTRDQAKNVIVEAEETYGFVIHTVVSNELRDFILKQGRLHNVETIDIMGPLLAQLSYQFSYSPSEKPGLFNKLNQAYFQRIEAMEFALRHDDGQRTEELNKAEIVILGVSRTFKTPLSIYLAFRGWLVANIPIILDMNLPPTLYKLPPSRVFGLTTNPTKLAALRSMRHEHLGGATGNYAKIEHVRRELTFARKLYHKQPKWSIINVTNKPIEEIAAEILAILRTEQ